MKPVLYTYDGTAINDGSNYTARIIYDTALQATQARAQFVARAGMHPAYVGKVFLESYIEIIINCLGTASTQFEAINQLFDINDEDPNKLIIKDADDSNAQYYIYCTPVKITPVLGKSAVQITLARKDAIWQTETETSDTWTITGSGDKQNITNGANAEAYPKFEFTPTSYPTIGYIYERHVYFTPNATAPFGNRPVEILSGLDTAALVANAAVSNQINEGAGIDDAVDTWSIDAAVGGGLAVGGGTFYVGTEQCSYTSIAAGEIIGVTRGINGTTAAAHADDAVMTQSIVQADGDDFRVVVNGKQVDRWFGTGTAAFNTAATKCWIALDVPAKKNIALLTAIADSGTPSYIDLVFSKTNLAVVKTLPSTGYVRIDTEEFAYTSITITSTTLRLNLGTRSVRNTVAATHAVNATVKWCPFQISVIYSNSAETAIVVDDTKKPIIDLENSTNISFVYATFLDTASPIGQRAGSWKPTLLKSAGKTLTKSDFYFGDNAAADTDPAQVMGMKIASFLSRTWKIETAYIVFVGNFPDLVSAVTSNGYKYRYSTSWPSIAALESSSTGAKWITEWNETTPASVQTWTAWTHNAEAVSSYPYIRFEFSGKVLGSDSNYSAFEVSGATITLVNYPTISLGAQLSNYCVEAKIINNTTEEFITIECPMQINQTLTIDCDPEQPYASKNGTIVDVVTPNTNRSNWLHLKPGTNELEYTSTATNNITCVVKHRDRMNFV